MNNTIKKTDRDHYAILLRAKKDSLKKEVINRTKTKTTVNTFVTNNKVVTNTEEIAYSCNSFYETLNLASKILKTRGDPASYISKQNPDSIFLNYASEMK